MHVFTPMRASMYAVSRPTGPPPHMKTSVCIMSRAIVKTEYVENQLALVQVAGIAKCFVLICPVELP
jgi:hypothetical protein